MKRNWKYQDNEQFDGDDSPKIITLEKSSDLLPQGNRIYFYSDVNKDSVLNLTRQIDDLTRQLKMVQFGFNLKETPRIELHICSDGGDLYSSMAVVDKISDNSIPIDTYCEGMVASAATLISAMGHRRYITKSSCMLIHQLSSGMWGNYAQFKDEIKNLDLLMNFIRSVYLKKTKFEPKELDEILSHDLCLTASQCLDYGLIDEIL